ncbi:related to cytochrome P450 CYP3/CYP5/CYP6/CYP9 subfamilies [Phialocephala subalpina]|uniref:Related to cytochrome P450 CYP3/CYP5/CYP6/CYP9 subfamilies n=1 Tax=Phialocephala subalpina TaxID=576137 RepID=A0A1L7WKH3_9HELO|nr:related to cytochrome P450 CYP3/CYP5/CYP6/CYP9 subfamilies [Phialocephala subalpina]
MLDLTLTNGLVAFLLGTTTCILSTAFYNLYFHPLSKFPGPKLWAAFQFPYLQAMLGGRVPFQIKALHDIHGPIVRTSPNELSIIDPGAWKEIYANKRFIRPPQYLERPPGVEAHSLISAGVADHARFRKAIAPAFSEKAVKLQEPIVTQYIDLLIKKLREKVEESQSKSAVVDVVHWINFATFDIISDLGWGKSFHCLEKQDYDPWMTVILQFKALLIGFSLNYYPILKTLVGYITPASALAGLKLVLDTSKRNVKTRLARKSDRPDMMSYILAHNEFSPSTRMSEEEMIANSMAVIVAGSETLTAALAGTINALLTHAKERKTLVKEIRSCFKDEDEISVQSTKSLLYLTAVLQEGLRLFPPLPDNMHRAVPSGGATIAGHHLPEGIVVGIPCYSTFRSRTNFSRPNEFLPERWLPEHQAEYNDRREAFNPFGLGAHGCLGQQLAWAELRVILARSVWNFDMRVPEGKKQLVWTEQKIFWAWDKEAVDVELSLAAR